MSMYRIRPSPGNPAERDISLFDSVRHSLFPALLRDGHIVGAVSPVGHHSHLAFQTGGLFSKKDATPSLQSSVSASLLNRSRTPFKYSARGHWSAP